MNQLKALVLAALLAAPVMSGCMEEAFALPPVAIPDPADATRVGGSHWGRQWTVPTTAGTAGLVLHVPGDNTYAVGDPHLFEWNTTIRISCQAAAVFHWVLGTTVTVATTGLVTDANPMTGYPATGGRGVLRVEAGTYVEDAIMRSMFDPTAGNSSTTRYVGARTGFCTGTTAASQLFDGWPCRADADCPSGACRGEDNGSCTESSVNYCGNGIPFEKIRGGFLQSLGATAADCWVDEVR